MKIDFFFITQHDSDHTTHENNLKEKEKEKGLFDFNPGLEPTPSLNFLWMISSFETTIVRLRLLI